MERVQEAAATATQTAKEYVQASKLDSLPWAALVFAVPEQCVWQEPTPSCKVPGISRQYPVCPVDRPDIFCRLGSL